MLTGEPLIFGKQKLLDGQNRLMGCVRSEQRSFAPMLVFGIDDTVFSVINSGKSRTNGDTFFTAPGGRGPRHRLRCRALADDLCGLAIRKARTSYSNQQVWDFYNDPSHLNKEMLEKGGRSAPKRSRCNPTASRHRGALLPVRQEEREGWRRRWLRTSIRTSTAHAEADGVPRHGEEEATGPLQRRGGSMPSSSARGLRTARTARSQ